MQEKTVVVKAYAKVNLGLQVLNKRPDGYHNINTLFAKLSLHDILTFSKAADLSVLCKPSMNISKEDNLVYQAAKIFKNSEKSIKNDYLIEIDKIIPSGAGLGGGSSDAAAALAELNNLNNNIYSFRKLCNLAQSLGSDVPFFLGNGIASATGRGEILDYYDLHLPWHVLIIYPNIHISTTDAYRYMNRTEEYATNKIDFISILKRGLSEPEILKGNLVNDFENYIFSKYPEIKKIPEQLFNYGAFFSSLSGSGSAVYGLFDSNKKCKKASLYFKQYQTFISTFV